MQICVKKTLIFINPKRLQNIQKTTSYEQKKQIKEAFIHL